MLRGQTILLLSVIAIVAFSAPTAARVKSSHFTQSPSELVAQAVQPSYIPWYTPPPSPWPNPTWPAPIPSAYAAIDGAFAVGNIYDTGSQGFAHPSGFDMYISGLCNFVCFGVRGHPSHHVFAFGSDDNAYSFTHQGGADDHTVAGISNQIYSVAVSESSSPEVEAHYVAVDGKGKVGVADNVAAGSSVIAGAGTSNPYPSPTAAGGSLVSHTGAGTGELRMGSATDYVRCDYGVKTTDVLTCNSPLMVAETTSSTLGAVAPCYKSGGDPCDGTYHIVKNKPDPNITTGGSGCAANSWCSSLTGATISLSGPAVFADGNYACALSSSSSYQLLLVVNAQTTTNFTIQAYNPGIAIGVNKPLGINYVCFGN